MEDLISTEEKTRMLSVISSFDIPVPFIQETKLMDSCFVAGLYYREDPLNLVKTLSEGDMLMFEREPDNEYDARAIAIKKSSGEFLGYVPKKKNEVLSNLMDAGKMIYAKVVHAEAFPNLSVEMSIYMKD